MSQSMLYKLGYGVAPPFFTFHFQTKTDSKNPTAPFVLHFRFFVFIFQYSFNPFMHHQFPSNISDFTPCPPSPLPLPILPRCVILSCQSVMSLCLCHLVMSICLCQSVMSLCHIITYKLNTTIIG
jgi:hypothetical protein